VLYKGPPIQKVCAGGDFSVMADTVGNVYTFGSPEYGQLGEQALNCYNTNRFSVIVIILLNL
jgi:alpha-tubulin suppressor-like RCC1 family protein